MHLNVIAGKLATLAIAILSTNETPNTGRAVFSGCLPKEGQNLPDLAFLSRSLSKAGGAAWPSCDNFDRYAAVRAGCVECEDRPGIMLVRRGRGGASFCEAVGTSGGGGIAVVDGGGALFSLLGSMEGNGVLPGRGACFLFSIELMRLGEGAPENFASVFSLDNG